MDSPAVVRTEAWAAARHDVVSVPQARALGLSPQSVGRLVRRGAWVRLHRGVCWTRPTERLPPSTALVAARLFAGGLTTSAGVVAGGSAARLWGLDDSHTQWTPELVLPHDARRPQPPGVRYRWSRLSATDVTKRVGIPMMTVDRTLRDLAPRLSFDEMLVVADAALRTRSADRAAVLSAADMLPRRHRQALLAADARAESAFESRVRAELIRAGVLPPVLQHVVRGAGGHFLGRVDFAWPERRLIVEADGAGVHASAAALRDDVRRQNALVAAGWTVLRFTWADLGTIAGRVTAVLAATAVA